MRVLSAHSQRPHSHRSVGVVVGSGGIKPIAAIPLFHFLERHQITPKLLVGCSGGAYISAFWDVGYRGERIWSLLDRFRDQVIHERMFSRLNIRTILAAGGYPFGAYTGPYTPGTGMLDATGILDFYRSVFGDHHIEDLEYPLCICTTDLATGDPYIIETGPLVESVYASGSLYPILPPMFLQDRWLVDGGYHNGVPIMEAIKRDVDVIIVLAFEERLQPQTAFRGFLDFFSQFVNQVAIENSRNQIPLSLHMHPHDLIMMRYVFPRPIAMWDMDALSDIVRLGEQVVKRYESEILRAVFG